MKLVEKGYKLNLDLIEQGFCYDDRYTSATSRNKAKSNIWNQIKYDGHKTYLGDQVTYLNIPIKRYEDGDLFLLEDGRKMTIEDIKYENVKIERNKKLDDILNDTNVKYCYIKKRGLYYRPDNCGYTEYKISAGIYSKEDAVGSGRGCHDLIIVPIDIQEHNKVLQEHIESVKSRLI